MSGKKGASRRLRMRLKANGALWRREWFLHFGTSVEVNSGMTAMARSMLFALAFGLLACIGNVGHAQAPVQPKTGAKKGLVIVAGGVGKLDVATYAARWALPRAGILHDI